MKTLQPATFIRQALHDATIASKAKRRIWAAAIESFRKFDGCVVSKAFATRLEKQLPGMAVYYEKSKNDGSHHIKVWGEGLLYGERETFYLSSQKGFDYAEFVNDYTQRAAASAKYVEDMTAAYAELPELRTNFEIARDAYEKAVADFGSLGNIALSGSL